MVVRRNRQRISKRQEKICNLCGEMVLNFTVVGNAPLCEECVPMKPQKKIINECGMLNQILGDNK